MSKPTPSTPKEPVEPKANAHRSIAVLLECDERGLWRLTHCRTQGTDIDVAIHAASTHPPSNSDLLAIQAANINRAVWGYMEGLL